MFGEEAQGPGDAGRPRVALCSGGSSGSGVAACLQGRCHLPGGKPAAPPPPAPKVLVLNVGLGPTHRVGPWGAPHSAGCSLCVHGGDPAPPCMPPVLDAPPTVLWMLRVKGQGMAGVGALQGEEGVRHTEDAGL